MPAQLAWNPETASFITSEYDQNVADEFKANNSGFLSLCDSASNEVTIAPSVDGGHVITKPTDNIYFVTNSAGKVTAVGSGSTRDQYVAGL